MYHVQVQKSFLGIKYWRTFDWANSWEVANSCLSTHRFNENYIEQKIIHDIN